MIQMAAILKSSNIKISKTKPWIELKLCGTRKHWGNMDRTLVKSAERKFNFLISQPKHMLWLLKRTISMRQFFWAQKHMLKLTGKKIFTFLRWKFVCLEIQVC